MHAEPALLAECAGDRFGDGAEPELDRGAVGDQPCDMLGYGAVDGSPMSSEGSGRGRSASRSQESSAMTSDERARLLVKAGNMAPWIPTLDELIDIYHAFEPSPDVWKHIFESFRDLTLMDLADRFRERADLCEQWALDPKGYPAWMLADRREPAANQYRAHADALEIASRRAVQ